MPHVEATREERGRPDVKISGLGDASLNAIYRPWVGDDSVLGGLSLNFGFILPTGNARDQPSIGMANPQVFQLGTGTTQLTFGFRYGKQLDENWRIFGSFMGTLPLYESSNDFLPAETLLTSIGVSRSITENVTAKLGLEYFLGGRDEFRDVEIENTGSQTLSSIPSLVYRVSDDLSASVSAALPIYREVNATALAAGPVYSLGLSYNF